MNVYEYFNNIKSFGDTEYGEMVSLFGKNNTDNYLKSILNGRDEFNFSDELRAEIICFSENMYGFNTNKQTAVGYINDSLYLDDASVLSKELEREYAVFLFEGRTKKENNIYFVDKMGDLRINDFDAISNVILNSDSSFRKLIIDKFSLCVKESNNSYEINKFYQLKRCINSNMDINGLINNNDFKKIDEFELLRQLEVIYNYRYARNQLILHNRRLVFFIAKKIYTNSGGNVSFEDIYSEGIIGLMRAIGSFDYHYNDKFSTYAVFWIRSVINRMMSSRGGLIYCPPHLYDFIRRADVFINDYFSKYGVRPTDLEVANSLRVDLDYYLEYRNNYSIYIVGSLDYSKDNDANTMYDNISSFSYDMDELIFKEELRCIFEKIFLNFDDRCVDIIKMHFGIFPYSKEHSLREISVKYGLTVTRIRQIRDDFFKKVRYKLIDNFDGYVLENINLKKKIKQVNE